MKIHDTFPLAKVGYASWLECSYHQPTQHKPGTIPPSNFSLSLVFQSLPSRVYPSLWQWKCKFLGFMHLKANWEISTTSYTYTNTIQASSNYNICQYIQYDPQISHFWKISQKIMLSPFHTSAFPSQDSTKNPSEFPCYTGMPVSLAEFGRCYCLRFDAKVRWSHGGGTHFPWAVSSIYPKDSAGMTQGWDVLVLKMTPGFRGSGYLGYGIYVHLHLVNGELRFLLTPQHLGPSG